MKLQRRVTLESDQPVVQPRWPIHNGVTHGFRMWMPGTSHCQKLVDERMIIAVRNAKDAACIARPDVHAHEN
jgi:hypothetical protein